jgi:hypothetical protein
MELALVSMDPLYMLVAKAGSCGWRYRPPQRRERQPAGRDRLLVVMWRLARVVGLAPIWTERYHMHWS